LTGVIHAVCRREFRRALSIAVNSQVVLVVVYQSEVRRWFTTCECAVDRTRRL